MSFSLCAGRNRRGVVNERAYLREEEEWKGSRCDPISEMGHWLRSVVNGCLRRDGVSIDIPTLASFWFQSAKLWHGALPRRSQNGRISRDRLRRLLNRCSARPVRQLDVQ